MKKKKHIYYILKLKDWEFYQNIYFVNIFKNLKHKNETHSQYLATDAFSQCMPRNFHFNLIIIDSII